MYIFREMETFKDSEAIASQVYTHNTLKSAESQLHQTMGSAIANENVRMVVCEIINERGDIHKYDVWYEPIIPEFPTSPEPEEE